MSWPVVRIDSCTRIVGGSTPDTNCPEYWGGEIPWATPRDLGELNGDSIAETPRRITEAGLSRCSSEMLPANSVLFSSRAPIGHVAINTVPMATNQGFKSFVPDPEQLNSKFLYHWLRANKTYLQSLGNGATFKEISKEVVSRIRIPLPPLQEQRRISAILDQAEALRAKRHQALAKLDTLTQSLFLEMFCETVSSSRYEVVPLSEAVAKGTIVTYGIVQAGEEFRGGVPYIRTGDIQDGIIVESDLRRTDPAIAAKFTRSRVNKGDLVMSIRATVGTVASVPASLAGANLTQGTARIAPGETVEGVFLLHYLRSDEVQRWIQRQVKGATFREITLDRLRQLPVKVPPLLRQRQFGASVARIDSLRQNSAASLTSIDVLFGSLQHRAFSGEL